MAEKYVIAITIKGGVQVVENDNFNQVIGICVGLSLFKRKYNIVKSDWFGTSRLTASENGLLRGAVNMAKQNAKKIIPNLEES